jgi:hypothetical protein
MKAVRRAYSEGCPLDRLFGPEGRGGRDSRWRGDGPRADRASVVATAEATSSCAAADFASWGAASHFTHPIVDPLGSAKASASTGPDTGDALRAASFCLSRNLLGGILISRFQGGKRTCDERRIWVTDADGGSRVRRWLRDPQGRSVRRPTGRRAAPLPICVPPPTPAAIPLLRRVAAQPLDFSLGRNQNKGTRVSRPRTPLSISILVGINRGRLPIAGSHD